MNEPVARRTFLMLGSGEFEAWVADAEHLALAGATGDGSVVVLPTASATDGQEVFDRWARMGVEHYEAAGITAHALPVKAREDAMRDDFVGRVRDASMVFFSGGKPKHLAEVMDGTPLWSAVLASVARGGVYAGCSAGAMVASQARDSEGANDGRTGWTFGLGVLPHISFGVHWDKVRFVPGLRPFVMSRIPRGTWFVGIDERTAVLGDGSRWQVFGRGKAMVRHAKGTESYGAGDSFETIASDER